MSRHGKLIAAVLFLTSVSFVGQQAKSENIAEKRKASKTTLDFYWLKDVQSKRNPNARWEMLPTEADKQDKTVYIFRDRRANYTIRGDTPDGQRQILLKVINAYDPANNPKGIKPLLTNADFKPTSEFGLGSNGFSGSVRVKLNEKGTRVFAGFTRTHINERLAVLLNGRILTALAVNRPITYGVATLDGVFASVEEAEDMIQALNASVRHRPPPPTQEITSANVRLEFYWLTNIQSSRNPYALWDMRMETDEYGNEIHAFRNVETRGVVEDDTAWGREKILLKVINAYDPAKNPKGIKPFITNSDLKPEAKAGQNLYGQPNVVVQLNEKGAEKFAKFTDAHVDDTVAFVLNGRLLLAAMIREPIHDNHVEMAGFASLEEAQRVADALNAAVEKETETIVTPKKP